MQHGRLFRTTQEVAAPGALSGIYIAPRAPQEAYPALCGKRGEAAATRHRLRPCLCILRDGKGELSGNYTGLRSRTPGKQVLPGAAAELVCAPAS